MEGGIWNQQKMGYEPGINLPEIHGPILLFNFLDQICQHCQKGAWQLVFLTIKELSSPQGQVMAFEIINLSRHLGGEKVCKKRPELGQFNGA